VFVHPRSILGQPYCSDPKLNLDFVPAPLKGYVFFGVTKPVAQSMFHMLSQRLSFDTRVRANPGAAGMPTQLAFNDYQNPNTYKDKPSNDERQALEAE
jgi:hypothetical protein